ncbi:molybdenum cofactor guanylyltransferase [Halorhabdus sp. CUG00001]|uniref:molybdenum cofactor guanylyltransferase n=1 Tax=Halorhabdus sp. CUG00001 TaxID=2600297 RepID=UPI00131D9690|nr:molybdenum cofactor guanylyltransferase [Halorhabdus sp. CUG00001]
MQPTDEATAVVLAGGGSRRFADGSKALATVDGEPMLERVVRTAASVTDGTPIVAVGSADQREGYADALDTAIRFVVDAGDRAGPLAGLERAVTVADSGWLLVLACDLPLVDPGVLSWLADQRSPEIDAIIPETGGETHPLHAWYRRESLRNELVTNPETQRVRELLDGLAVRPIPAAERPDEFDLARSVRNVNTVAELRRVRQAIDDERADGEAGDLDSARESRPSRE